MLGRGKESEKDKGIGGRLNCLILKYFLVYFRILEIKAIFIHCSYKNLNPTASLWKDLKTKIISLFNFPNKINESNNSKSYPS